MAESYFLRYALVFPFARGSECVDVGSYVAGDVVGSFFAAATVAVFGGRIEGRKGSFEAGDGDFVGWGVGGYFL